MYNYFCSLCIYTCTYIPCTYRAYIYTQMYIGYSIFIELSDIDINTDICVTYICTYTRDIYIYTHTFSHAFKITSYA